MIHTRHIYKTSLQSSPLHYQPSQCFGYFMPLHNRMIAQVLTFQWPCVKVKAIQTGTKLQKSAVSSIIPNLKQIGSYIQWPMLQVYFINCLSIVLSIKYYSTNQQVVAAYNISSKLTLKFAGKCGHKFDFLCTCDLEWRLILNEG